MTKADVSQATTPSKWWVKGWWHPVRQNLRQRVQKWFPKPIKAWRHMQCLVHLCYYKSQTISSMYRQEAGVVYGRTYYCSKHQSTFFSKWTKPLRREVLK